MENKENIINNSIPYFTNQRSTAIHPKTRKLIRTFLRAKKLRGVYFLIYEKNIVYVGASINIIRRIKEHFLLKKYRETMLVDSFYYMESNNENLVNEELLYITEYNPIYNKGNFAYPKKNLNL